MTTTLSSPARTVDITVTRSSGTEPESPDWQHGVVSWFDVSKGFGFLAAEAGPAVFVDYRVIDVPGLKALAAGQLVAYTVSETPRGPEATRVVPSLN
ncbi:cold shock domain-containing protein [Nocardia sp. NPDC048505]|uniref:cold shock domain-containing protein n=1 Tax=unclassified Nocardia TaxID=2637762 RepID=UPI0033C6A06D